MLHWPILGGVRCEKSGGNANRFLHREHSCNKNTQRAYYKAACQFSDWCEGRGLLDLANVKPPHVAIDDGWRVMIPEMLQGFF
jgi:hypothetical protein